MVMRSVGFQLRTDGKAEVKNDFAEVRAAGTSAMTGVADAAEQAGERAARATESYATRQIEAWKRQANAAKLAAAAGTDRSAIDSALSRPGNAGQFATVNLDRSTGSARASAAVFEAEARAMDDAAAAAAKLRAAVDPLWAAEQRLAVELAEVNLAGKSGILTTEQLANAQAMARRRFDETTAAIRRQQGESAGLSKMQRQTLIYTASDIVASGASGASPAMIAMQQGPQVLQAFAAEEGGMAALKATLTGTAAAVTALTAAAAIGAASWFDYTSSMTKLNAVARGAGAALGLSGEELEKSAEAAAKAGRISVSAARDIETGYLDVARSGDVLVKLTAITKDFAAATGQEMVGAQRDLGAAFADPIAGADDLAAKYGVLSQAQIDRIAKLVEENDLAGAQRVLLEALGPAFAGAADNANILARSWDGIKDAAADAWNWMGKALDRLATGGSIAQRVQDLQAQRARGPSVGQMLMGTSTAEYQAHIDKQIATLQNQARQEAARIAQARDNTTRAAAQAIVDRHTGDQRSALRADVGRIRAALRTDLPDDQRAQLTSTLTAYTHAIDTWIPSQEKANQLAAIDAKLAAAKTPAAKAALAAERTRVEMSGQLVNASDVEARATANATRARESGAKSGDKHADSLRRQAASMEESARAALDVADAYLKSAAAGITAEARRKALTDATRKGIDVDAQVRRELNLQVSDGIATGAKNIAQMREETTARRAVNDNVKAGTLSVDAMNQALSDEAALRPLLTLAAVAQANGMSDAYQRISAAIAQYRAGLKDAHDEEARSNGAKLIAESRQRAADMRASILAMSGTPVAQLIGDARRAAEREADAQQLQGAERTELVNARIDEARTARAKELARYTLDGMQNQDDALALTRREIELVGASDSVRAAELEKLRAEQEIRRQFPEMAQADIDARLTGIDLQEQANARLRVMSATMDEVKTAGGQFVDTVLSEDTWSSWGNAGKTMTRMIEGEFIKLALLNPLRNMISGNNDLPTLGGFLGAATSLFSGGKAALTASIGSTASGLAAASNSAFSSSFSIGRNATGTERHSGGLTWVNENGPEIADLPDGTRIYPAAETRRMLAAGNDNGPSISIPISIDATGADPAGIARVEAQIAALRRDLPGIIVNTVNEARDRRAIR